MPDQTLKCVDCGQDFTFSVRDQAYHAQQKDKITGLPWGPPKRCKPCRDIRRQRKVGQDQQRA